MLNLPLRPQVLFLSLLPPHLLVCRAEQALGSRRLCLLLQTAAEAPGSQAGDLGCTGQPHIPCFPCKPAAVPWTPGGICPCALLGAVLCCVFALVMQCWGSAGAAACRVLSWLLQLWAGAAFSELGAAFSLCSSERSPGWVRGELGRSSASPLGLGLSSEAKPSWPLLQCLHFVPVGAVLFSQAVHPQLLLSSA